MKGEGVRKVWEFVSAARGENEVSPSIATRDVLGKTIVDPPSYFSMSIWSEKPALLAFWIHTS